MTWDNHKNFAISTVAAAPSPAISGVSLDVASGDGAALFPAATFNAVVWPAADPNPTAANAELVRVTAKASDTFTITRAQESTSAKSIATGWNIAAVLSVKTITDLETAIDAVAAGVVSGYQPLDSDLTAIAALSTTSFGRGLLALANAAALRTAGGLVIGTDVQAHDSDLDSIAALSTTTYGRALLELANAAALRTAAGLVIGTDVEAHDSDLSTFAGLSPANDDVLQRKAGAWTNRTIAQLLADLGIVAGSGWDAVPTKASTDSVASSTTPAADSELTYATVSGHTYEFEATLLIDSPAGGTTPDFKFAPAEDGVTRGAYIAQGFGTGDSLSATSIQAVSTLGTTAWGTAAAQRQIMVKGTLLSAGGPFAIYWSQNTSGVNATRLLAGSTLRIRRIV